MKHIKIIEKGWEGYTGLFGPIPFENGVSVEPVTQIMIDRLAGTVSIVEIDADGEAQAGAAARLVGGATLAFEPTGGLKTASEDELAAEQARIALEAAAAKKKPLKFHSLDELEAIGEKEGIKGLRKIGDAWAVRGRGIVELIKEILKAQGEMKARLAEETKAKGAAEPAESPAEIVEPALPTEAALVAAIAGETAPKTEVETAPAQETPAQETPAEPADTVEGGAAA